LSATAALLTRADQLAAEGQALEAIRELTAANREQSDAALERALVRLRHAAWPELDRTGPGAAWDALEPAGAAAGATTATGSGAIPEVAAADLDADTIRAAIASHGGLVVRRLLSEEWCTTLRDDIDHSWDAIEHYNETQEVDQAWFDPVDTDKYGLTMQSRSWPMSGGTAYVPDSPRLLFDLLDAFEEAGVKRVVTDYFLEPPALSLIKIAQRRLAPEASGGWHQDAAVYGSDARTLNFWVPVSRCGDVAPGLEMWPRRLDYIVETIGTKGVAEFYPKKAEVAKLTSQVPGVRPVFEPGDAAIFDQFLLHQTASSPEFSQQRYGFECWFFAPSTYPDPNRWIPLVY
jgi:hypothetical protein